MAQFMGQNSLEISHEGIFVGVAPRRFGVEDNVPFHHLLGTIGVGFNPHVCPSRIARFHLTNSDGVYPIMLRGRIWIYVSFAEDWASVNCPSSNGFIRRDKQFLAGRGE